MIPGFARAEAAYMEPPDEPVYPCRCQCPLDDHDEDGRCTACGDCTGYEEYDAIQAREDHEAELADIAWKERDL